MPPSLMFNTSFSCLYPSRSVHLLIFDSLIVSRLLSRKILSLIYNVFIDPPADRLLQVRMNIMSPAECSQSLIDRFGYSFNISIYQTTILCVGTEPTEGIGICNVSFRNASLFKTVVYIGLVA